MDNGPNGSDSKYHDSLSPIAKISQKLSHWLMRFDFRSLMLTRKATFRSKLSQLFHRSFQQHVNSVTESDCLNGAFLFFQRWMELS
jgi:hypothetical protein